MNNPWLKFYPSDWRADPALRMCSIGARGLWMEMLCLMHDASPRGSLLINSRQVTERQLATLAGIGVEEVKGFLGELEEAGVFSRDEDGTIFSRRMRRDDEKAEQDRANGRKGGNPTVKGRVNPGDETEVNPPSKKGVKGGDKAQKPEARSQMLDNPQSPQGGGGQDDLINLRVSITRAFEEAGNPSLPDTSRAGVWLAKGYSAAIILAVVRECLSKNKRIRNLSYFDHAIDEAHQKRTGEASPTPPPPDPASVRRGYRVMAHRFLVEQSWSDAWGPRPGMPGCRVPDDVIAEVAAEHRIPWLPVKEAVSCDHPHDPAWHIPNLNPKQPAAL